MTHFLVHNGQYVKNDKAIITADNRGFRYGDGLFETMKWMSGKLLNADVHFKRFFDGLKLFGFECPSYFSADYFLKLITELVFKNQHTSLARIRLMVYRSEGGLYDVANHFPNFIIQSWPLNIANNSLNENGLVIGLYTKAKKAIDSFSNCKHNNYLPYVMAALHAKKNNWNDALIYNSNNNICDATIANVFMVKGNIIFTPPLSEGCVAGTTRNWLLQQTINYFSFKETAVSYDDVVNADELFLTNAIYGLRWVQRFEEKEYECSVSQKVHKLYQQTFLQQP